MSQTSDPASNSDASDNSGSASSTTDASGNTTKMKNLFLFFLSFTFVSCGSPPMLENGIDISGYSLSSLFSREQEICVSRYRHDEKIELTYEYMGVSYSLGTSDEMFKKIKINKVSSIVFHYAMIEGDPKLSYKINYKTDVLPLLNKMKTQKEIKLLGILHTGGFVAIFYPSEGMPNPIGK
jgi:hypothetical protein